MAIQTEEQTELLTKEPGKYAVFMLNDDYTTWEFCIRIICAVFHNRITSYNVCYTKLLRLLNCIDNVN